MVTTAFTNKRTSASARNTKGFTLVEFLLGLVMALLIVGAVVMALFYLTVMSSTTKNESRVFQDAQVTMERVSGTALSDLDTQFQNNQPLSSTFVTDMLGGYKVLGETITVSYPSGITSNPREVLVTASWPERGGTRTISLRSFRRG